MINTAAFKALERLKKLDEMEEWAITNGPLWLIDSLAKARAREWQLLQDSKEEFLEELEYYDGVESND